MIRQYDLFDNHGVDKINDIENSIHELVKRNEEQAVSYQRQIRCLFGKINFLENYILDMEGLRRLQEK